MSNKQLSEKRRRRSQLVNSSLLEGAVLESSTVSTHSDQSKKQTCASSSFPIPSKKRRRIVMSPQLAGTLDRTKAIIQAPTKRINGNLNNS